MPYPLTLLDGDREGAALEVVGGTRAPRGLKVIEDGGRRIGEHDGPAPGEEHRAIAKGGDLMNVVRNEDHGLARLPHLPNRVEALVPEGLVSNSQDLVQD